MLSKCYRFENGSEPSWNILQSVANGRPSLQLICRPEPWLNLSLHSIVSTTTYTSRVRKSAINGTTLILGHQMVPYTVKVRKSALTKLPQFGPTLQLDHQRVPPTGWLLKLPYFGPTLSMVPIQADWWKVFGPNFSVGQQMAPIQSWLFADWLTVLFQWPCNGQFKF